MVSNIDERRRVGRGLGPPRLAVDALDLGKAGEDAVLELEHPLCLADRDARERRRHVEDRTLGERRHELRAEPEIERQRSGEDRQRDRDDRLRPLEDEAAGGVVDPLDGAAHRVALLGVVGADQEAGGDARQEARLEGERIHAREEHAQRRVERDREERREQHRQVLRPRQRPEEPALLVDQREDRQEGDGDDQEREEDRRPDLLQRLETDLVEVPLAPADLPEMQLVVGVLDLDDGAVDQDADRDRDPGEGHDVDRDAEQIERNEGQQDRDRDRDDRHDRRREVPEEEQDDERDDDHLQHQLVLQGVQGAQDEIGAVVGRDHLDARRQAHREVGELRLHPADDVQRVLAVPHDDDAADRVALAVEVGGATPRFRPELDRRHVAHPQRHA